MTGQEPIQDRPRSRSQQPPAPPLQPQSSRVARSLSCNGGVVLPQTGSELPAQRQHSELNVNGKAFPFLCGQQLPSLGSVPAAPSHLAFTGLIKGLPYRETPGGVGTRIRTHWPKTDVISAAWEGRDPNTNYFMYKGGGGGWITSLETTKLQLRFSYPGRQNPLSSLQSHW